jgi:hypothetical protein|uniref:Primase C terminal 2 (PriCT-2) n=1 Tax=Siphoviridae sp. ctNyC15 TaxID=2826307 RepID=A0A8S5NDU3_9CAUD|nr:MAG TPA: Primase C terminal 2 (PriCT-2) [Siphoviridae sp. ctNyC15]
MEKHTDLQEIIEYLNPAELDYQDWVNVGMALKHEGYSVDVWDTYREDGVLNNTAITGDYENLYLQEGLNEISVSSGFTAEVIPKWGVRL